jgi:hypothetical protein
MAENNVNMRNLFGAGTPPDISALVGVLRDIADNEREMRDGLSQLLRYVQNNSNTSNNNRSQTHSNEAPITEAQLRKVLDNFIKYGSRVFVDELNQNRRTTTTTDSSGSRNNRNFTTNYYRNLNIDNPEKTTQAIESLSREVNATIDKLNRQNSNVDLSNLQKDISELLKISKQGNNNIPTDVINNRRETLENSLNIQTSLASSQKDFEKLNRELFRQQLSRTPEKVQSAYTITENIRDFINPQNSEAFKSFLEQFDYAIEQMGNSIERLYNSKDTTDNQISENTAKINVNSEEIENLTEDLNNLDNELNELPQTTNELNEQFNRTTEYILQLTSALSNLENEYADIINNSKSRDDAYTKGFIEAQSDIYEQEKSRIEDEIQRTYAEQERLESEIYIQRAELNRQRERILNERKTVAEQIDLREQEQKLLNHDNERLKKESKLLADEIKTKESEKQQTEKLFDDVKKSENFKVNLLKKTLNTVTNAISDMVSNELNSLKSAADELFNSFEDTQRSIGKTLKMESGAYDEFAEKVADLAKSSGIAIDAKQLNEAAASMVEMGVSNENLILGLAETQAKINQSGSNLKLDEETVKQLQASYLRDINSGGLTEQQAYDKMQSAVDSMIAAEQYIRETYGSTSALSSGGLQEIQNWANKFTMSGDLDEDEFGVFVASMGGFMQQMENYGMDSSTILQDLDTILNQKQSALSPQLQDWLQSNNIGIRNAEDLYTKLSSADFGDIASSLLSRQAKQYENVDAMHGAYKADALGYSGTSSQLRAMQSFGEDVVNSYAKTSLSQEDLQTNLTAISSTISESIQDGDYLTATEKLEQKNLDLMTDVARNAQQITEGKFWMDKGLDVITGSINKATDLILGGLSSFVGSGLGNYMGSGGTNLGGMDGNTPNASGMGSISDFMTGNNSTTAGKIGTATGVAIGTAVIADSMISNAKQSESSSDWAEQTFTDPEFYAGVGTILGTAIAGPVGGAIGAVIGTTSSNIGNELADWGSNQSLITRTIWDAEWKREVEQLAEDQRVSERMTEAANALIEAGQLHMETANLETENLQRTEEWAKTADRGQKEAWLLNNKSLNKELENLTEEEALNKLSQSSDAELNAKFNEILQYWYDEENKKIAREELLSKSSNMTDSFENVIGVDNFVNYTEEDLLSDKDKLQQVRDYLSHNDIGHDPDDIADMLSKYNKSKEHTANVKMMATSKGYEVADLISDYITQEGLDSSEESKTKAFKAYFGEQYTDKQIAEMVSIYDDLGERQSNWENRNKDFQKAWVDATKDVPKGSSADTYLLAFAKEKNISVSDLANALEGYTTDGLASGYSVDESGLPMLRFSSEPMYDADNWAKINGAFRIGLDYVPKDDYGALLHEGEMVLNKSEANEYRRIRSNAIDGILNIHDAIQDTVSSTINNNMQSESLIDTSAITGSVNNQTDKLINILGKILQVLSSNSPNNRSYLPKSLVQMNSDISLL